MNAVAKPRTAPPALKDPTLLRDQSYIDGQWADADTRQRIDVDNPADGSLVATVPEMGAAEASFWPRVPRPSVSSNIRSRL